MSSPDFRHCHPTSDARPLRRHRQPRRATRSRRGSTRRSRARPARTWSTSGCSRRSTASWPPSRRSRTTAAGASTSRCRSSSRPSRSRRSHSSRAQLAGAVNTLMLEDDGRWYGDNTDGAGLVRDLTENLGDRRCATAASWCSAPGGAARGMLGPLLDGLPRSLAVSNRTHDKASRARGAVRAARPDRGDRPAALRGPPVRPRGQRDQRRPRLATSHDWPGVRVRPGAFAYDLVYADQPTQFVRWARRTARRAPRTASAC